MNKQQWINEIKLNEAKYNFKNGFKLLYCPWETIEKSKFAFISLNPGVLPDDEDDSIISDERGNSYLIERDYSKSPLTEQFLKMADFLNENPTDILTGVIHPFRSNRWKDFSKEQKEIGLQIGREFWEKVLTPQIKTIVVIGNEACKEVTDITNSKLIMEVNSGWGKYKLQRYQSSWGAKIIKLQHLSTYKLFSRDECLKPLTAVFYE